ncbi:MAG: leucine-rich repeat domain-containing protein, partial [Bryobacteraceae bacterium]
MTALSLVLLLAADFEGAIERDAAGRAVAIDLASSWITDASLGQVASLKDLRRIDLAHTRITDQGLERLKVLQNVTDLNCYFAERLTDDGVAHLKGWTRLERLNLRGTQVTSKVFEHLAKLAGLRSLDLAHTQIDDDGFEHIAGLPRLESLAIGGNRLVGSALTLLKTAPALRMLDVAGIQRVDSGLWGLSLTEANLDRLASLSTLETLDLSGANIADRGLDRPGSPEAERSELRDLSRLAKLERLRALDLSRTPINAKGLEAVARIPRLRELRLVLARNIDDAAAPALASMKLEALYLAGTGLTDAGLAKLHDA